MLIIPRINFMKRITNSIPAETDGFNSNSSNSNLNTTEGEASHFQQENFKNY